MLNTGYPERRTRERLRKAPILCAPHYEFIHKEAEQLRIGVAEPIRQRQVEFSGRRRLDELIPQCVPPGIVFGLTRRDYPYQLRIERNRRLIWRRRRFRRYPRQHRIHLAPKEALDQPAAGAPATVKELYRTTAPLPELKPGSYELNLTRVTFPPGMPSNPPHHRSGAALYYIVSGTGANTVAGKMADRGPGSLIYEPFGLVHQWGNPGNEPLTFLAFNINPEGVPAVVPEP